MTQTIFSQVPNLRVTQNQFSHILNTVVVYQSDEFTRETFTQPKTYPVSYLDFTRCTFLNCHGINASCIIINANYGYMYLYYSFFSNCTSENNGIFYAKTFELMKSYKNCVSHCGSQYGAHIFYITNSTWKVESNISTFISCGTDFDNRCESAIKFLDSRHAVIQSNNFTHVKLYPSGINSYLAAIEGKRILYYYKTRTFNCSDCGILSICGSDSNLEAVIEQDVIESCYSSSLPYIFAQNTAFYLAKWYVLKSPGILFAETQMPSTLIFMTNSYFDTPQPKELSWVSYKKCHWDSKKNAPSPRYLTSGECKEARKGLSEKGELILILVLSIGGPFVITFIAVAIPLCCC